VPAGDGWIHELKHDGFRVLAFKNRDTVRLWSRNGRDWSVEFVAITEAMRALPFSSASCSTGAQESRAGAAVLGAPFIRAGRSDVRHACAMGLAGIVSKRFTSRYKAGACKSWLKVKNPG
jgi:ATP-dependent DNA ligase